MSQAIKILGPHYSTFVRSVMMACEEKGVTYEYGMTLNGEAVQLGDEVHLKLHPFAKIPAVVLEDGTSICETGAVIRYIDAIGEKGGALMPKLAAQRAIVDQWSSLIGIYVDQAIVRKLLLEFAPPKGENGQVRMDKVEEALPSVSQSLTILSEQLGEMPFICGQTLSVADLLLIPMLDYLEKTPVAQAVFSEVANLTDYIERMRSQPCVKAVLVTHK